MRSMSDEATPADRPSPPGGGAPLSPGSGLGSLSQRLERLATELEGAAEDPARAAELVREASALSAEAGREVEAALEGAAETHSEQE